MIIINYSEAKQRLIKLVKSNTYDFCSDMLLEIRKHAENESIDDIESCLMALRQAENQSNEMVYKIENANSIGDMILATSDNDSVGNVLYENEEIVLEAIFGCVFRYI